MDKSIRAGLLVLLVFTALAYGTVEPWSVAVFELSVLVLMVLWCARVAAAGELTVRIPQACWPVAGLLLFGFVQAFAPGSGMSLDREATRSTVLLLSFILAFFVLTANFFDDGRRFRQLANFLTVYGLVMAVFALVQHFTWNGRFYWIRPNTQSASPFGPFPHHGHFAGYMGLLIAVPLGLVVARGVRGELRLFYAFSVVMMALADVVSLSRGGMLGLSAAVIFVLAMNALQARTRGGSEPTRRDRPTRRRGDQAARLGHGELVPASPRLPLASLAMVGAIVVAIFAGIVWLGPDSAIDRITGARAAVSGAQAQTESFSTSRGWIWRDTITMIKAHPIMGVGLGAFETAYPIYSRSDGSHRVSQAHNDYLQVLADGGVVCGALAVWFIALTVGSVARGLRSQDRFVRGLALGSGAGMTAVLVHSAFDFNLQIPSNALMYLLLVAVAHHAGAKRGAAY